MRAVFVSPLTFLLLSSLAFVLGTGVVLPAASADELLVSAAISLKDSFLEIEKHYERENPGSRAVFNFAGSGSLAAQIEQGAPVDVYAAASLESIDRLLKRRLVDQASVRKFAGNRLVVIVPATTSARAKSQSRPISALTDLAAANRLAVGDPELVPAGRYATRALKQAGVYAALEKRRAFVFGESVRQVLTYVENGNADAGIVYQTDARLSARVKAVMEIPATLSGPIVYPISVLKASKKQALADRFVTLVLSQTGQRILKERGFSAPPP